MRLSIPTEASSLKLLKGPGATALLDASIEKHKMGYRKPEGPKLVFTVENPIDGKPMKLTVEMIGNFDKVDGHYELYAAVGASFVQVKYWLRDTDGLGCGTVSDLD